MLSRMHHPGIVKLYFTFQDATWLYLAIELCPNGELAELIGRKGRLPLNLVQFYAGELVNILTYLRKLGVAHRDIKPENLFITDSGHLKLGDFDTAKVVIAAGSHLAAANQNHPERMNTFVGTAQYVSPEMLHDSAVAGFGSDLWALGCVVFQMLTGTPPFKSSSEYVTFQKILATDYSFPDNVPEVGQSFVRALLTLDPQDRLGFFKIDDLKRHPFLAVINVDSLESMDPPLQGVLRLRKKRIRMSSASIEPDDHNLLLDSSDEEEIGESSQLLDDDFINIFNNHQAPQSPTLVRCATTAPQSLAISDDDGSSSSSSIMIQHRRASADGSSTPSEALIPRTGQPMNAAFKKAGSSPALFNMIQPGRSRSFSNIQSLMTSGAYKAAIQMQEESFSGRESPARSSSMTSDAPPPMAIKSWTSNRNLSSKPSVIVESFMTKQSIDSAEDAASPDNRHQLRPSPLATDAAGFATDGAGADLNAASPTATAGFTNYLQRICASDEHILMSGNVLKRKFFGKNRILVITDLPRLLVLEPKTFRTVCEIPLLASPSAPSAPVNPTSSLLSGAPSNDSLGSSTVAAPGGLVVTFVSPTEFSIDTDTSRWKGEVSDGTAQAWVSLIQAMRQKAMKTASLRPPRSHYFTRALSPEIVSTGEILARSEFGSVDVIGSMYARGGYSSDLPTHAELEAEAEARVEAALKKIAENPDLSDPEAFVAALGRQISNPPPESPVSEDQCKIENGDIFSSGSGRRSRESSSSCSIM